MSTQPTPPSPIPGDLPAIEAELASSEQYIVNALNTYAKSNYQAEIATYIANYGPEPSASAPPPPAPPTLLVLDPASVEALEAQADALFAAGNAAAVQNLNWAGAITRITAPVIPIVPPTNTIVIGGLDPGGSGYYVTASGNASFLAAGFKVVQNGVSYYAVPIGFMGGVMWTTTPPASAPTSS